MGSSSGRFQRVLLLVPDLVCEVDAMALHFVAICDVIGIDVAARAVMFATTSGTVATFRDLAWPPAPYRCPFRIQSLHAAATQFNLAI